jgi:hypothetical protein
VADAIRQQGISTTLVTGGPGTETEQFDLVFSSLIGVHDCPGCEQLRIKNKSLERMLEDEIHANLVDEIAVMQGLRVPRKPIA